MKERTGKQEAIEWGCVLALILVGLAVWYAAMFGLASLRGGAHPHSEDPCSRTYQGPPAACIPGQPSSGLP